MIKNVTKNRVLAKEFSYCRSEWSKFRGLMFTKKLRKALVFVFKKEKLIGIHMFFVWYPIDILWLDSKKRVVDLRKNFKPFRIVISKRPAKYIIELEDGTIQRTKTSLGDKISF